MQILVIVCFLLFALLLFKNKDNFFKASKPESTEEERLKNLVEMEDEYYRKTAAGEQTLPFVKLFYQQDCMIVKSILQSEGIPYHVKQEHLSSVLIGQGVAGQNDTYFYILRKDYEGALKIINDFIAQKEKSFHKPKTISRVIPFSTYNPKRDDTVAIIIFQKE
ncbi:DUF2007 domain-containing protein [Treponema phagedenis]|uniref:DUF2007 domain-containing protein n=1 Tax=Treponema phagedenis TaxID=162 RepID=UPI0011E7E123|nr:DUF2007 domain-containing protein [Treponema phagedenis]QEK03565.1 DUF2007 domain-containing protein [Treponema phagedenis]